MHLLSDSWETVCAVCASGDYRGDLALRQHVDEQGIPATVDLERVRMCSSCYGVIRSALKTSASRARVDDLFPGVPARRAAKAGAGCCAVCWATEADFLAELLPGGTLFTAPLIRIGDRPVRLPLCRACTTWLREVLDEESIARWAQRRAIEQPDPRPAKPLACYTLGLPDRDQRLLRETLSSLGHSCHALRHAREVPGGGQPVLFIFAGKVTVQELEALPGDLVERTVVVSPVGHIDAALALMRAGARDLLVSPLSRQQVAGSLDRLDDPDAFAGRDTETGIPSYRPEPRFGLPCHLVAVEPPTEVAGLDVFLVLRRFLRGYDRVGLDSGSLLPVTVYCPAGHLPSVVNRMQGVLGDGFDLRVLASIDPYPADGIAGGPAQTEPTRGFWGARLKRQAS